MKEKRKLLILGGAGIGAIAHMVAHESTNYDVIGYLNDDLPKGSRVGRFEFQLPVLGNTADIDIFLEDSRVDFFIAYGGMGRLSETLSKIDRLNIESSRLPNLVHSSAIYPKGFSRIDSGVLMAPLSQLSPHSSAGKGCCLLPNSFLGHDSECDRFVKLATNSVVGALCKIGAGSHIGSNATIREKVIIGECSLVGAGAVVLYSCEANATLVGNPARVLDSPIDL